MSSILSLLVFVSSCVRLVSAYDTYDEEFDVFASKYDGTYRTFSAPTGASEPVEVTAYVPADVDAVWEEWQERRREVSELVGVVQPVGSRPPGRYNNASTSEELVLLAENAQDVFTSFVQGVIDAVPGTYASYGPNDNFLLKTLSSLERKVEQEMRVKNLTEEMVIHDINDAIRGTIVVQDPACVDHVVEQMLAQAPPGFAIVFKDAYNATTYDTGYVAVHATLAVDVSDDEDEDNELTMTLLCELQIHLESVFDGTLNSPKERSHPVYEVLRQIPLPVPADVERDLKAASVFIFLFGLDRAMTKDVQLGLCPKTATTGNDGDPANADADNETSWSGTATITTTTTTTIFVLAVVSVSMLLLQ